MTDILSIIKKLLFLSDEICTLFEELAFLSSNNRESSQDFDELIEQLDNYLMQESSILESMTKKDLISLLRNLFEIEIINQSMNRCYITVRDYFEDKYPYETNIIEDIETNNKYEEENNNEFEIYGLNNDYEDDEDVLPYRKYVIQKIAIRAIKKMYHRIKSTDTDNKIDHKYKKLLLKHFKEFKYYFFTTDRDMELLGIKYRFDIDAIVEYPELNIDISSICFNECIDLLDSMYYTKDKSRDPQVVEETLFDMLQFEECIKELSPEQIDKLIDICYEIEANESKNLYGNIGLQKLIKIKKS